MDALKRLKKGRTTFIIAHRFSTIRAAGRIVVLEHGCIAEQGRHTELMEAGGVYRRLYDSQALASASNDELRCVGSPVVENGVRA